MARIGFLATASIGSPEYRGVVDPFWRGLRDLGYVEGRNLVIEYRSADGKQERFPSLANDLVRLNVDLSSPPLRRMPEPRSKRRVRSQSSCQLWVIPLPTDSWPALRDRAGTSPG